MGKGTGEQQDLFAGGHHAKVFPLPGSRQEREMTAGSGKRLLELYRRWLPNGASLKMFTACLLSTTAWHSRHCALRWKTKGLKCNRILLVLSPLTPPTSGAAFGLLPTPSGTTSGKNHVAGRLDEWGGNMNPFRGTEVGKKRCATFEEWMMGLPIRFTE